jgi:ElaB/YqjD/DUF883 family membrane-anchored ribosome-binding protein
MKQQNIMEQPRHADGNNMSTLAEDARALVAATADVAGTKVADARKRLASALDSGKELIGRVRERAVDHAKAADEVIRDNPYQTVAIAFAVGAVIGYLAASRCSRTEA